MIIQQSSFLGGLVNRFEFGDTDLGFSQMAPGSGSSIAFRVAYADIPKAAATITIPNRRVLRLALVALVVLGIVTWAEMHDHPNYAEAFSFMLLGLFLVVRQSSVITITQFNTKMGSLQVLGGKQAISVITEIETRRSQVILSQYDRMDFQGAPDKARRALLWLKQESFLTETEFLTRMAALEQPACAVDVPGESEPATRLLN